MTFKRKKKFLEQKKFFKFLKFKFLSLIFKFP